MFKTGREIKKLSFEDKEKVILLVYAHSLNPLNWEEQYFEGSVPGFLPYGFGHLRRFGYEIITSLPSAPVIYMDKFIKFLTDIEMFHSISSLLRSRRRMCIFSLNDSSGIVLGMISQTKVWDSNNFHFYFPLFLAQRIKEMSLAKLKLIRYALKGVEKIFYQSRNQESIFKEFLNVPPEKLQFLPHSVDVNFYKPLNNSEGEYILSIGGDVGRDYQTLLQAAGYFKEKFIIVCRPWNQPKEGIPNNVILRQNLSHKEIRLLYSRAKFVVIPTKVFAYPTGSTVLLEAMSMGKASIITRTPAILDYVRENETALLVEPYSVESLRDAIRYLLDNPEECHRIGRNAREEVVENFSDEVKMKKISKILGEFLQERGVSKVERVKT
jgi:glycosyltransferase involved in cell wall biosynthesis